MNINSKYLALIEFFVILALLAVVVIGNQNKKALEVPCYLKEINSTGLLSKRIYSGILEPKSLLILNFDPLRDELEEYINKKNISASVYVENLRDGASFSINENKAFLPASLNKLPVAIIIMKKIERRELSLNTMIEIMDSDRTDTFGQLYKTKEKKLPLHVLLNSMLKESDNTAFRALRRQIKDEDLQFLLGYLDYYINTIDSKTVRKGYNENDFVSVNSIYNLFSSLYLSTVLNPKDDEYILSLLTDTVFDIKKIAHLPEDVVVAQKFGAEYEENLSYFHDCGIMYFGESRVFYCIMTENLSQQDAINFIGFTVNLIHKYFLDIRAELDSYKE